MSLKNITIGRYEAEGEHEGLSKYFLDTGVSQRILGVNSVQGKYLVLGRKGAGKSALSLHLKNLLEKDNKNVIESDMDQRLYAVISNKSESLDGLTLDDIWKFVIYVKIAKKLLDDDKVSKSSQKKIRVLFEYLNIKKNENILTKILSFLKFNRISLGAREAKISADVSQEQPPKYLYEILDEFETIIKSEVANNNVHVLIDKVDERWNGNDNDKESILYLLEAVRSINTDREFKRSYATCPPVILFLRTDIMDNLNSSNLNKVTQDTESIEWDKEGLVQVINKRIKASDTAYEKWTDVFDGSYVRDKKESDKYIYERTMNRPRDMIAFVGFSLKEANREGREMILTKDIIKAERQYGEYMYGELRDEIGTTSGVNKFEWGMGILKNIKHRYFTLELWRKNAKEIYSLDESTADDIFKIFIEASIIGKTSKGGVNKEGKSGGTQYIYAYDEVGGRVDYSEKDQFCVHLSLVKYLGLTSKNTRSKLEE